MQFWNRLSENCLKERLQVGGVPTTALVPDPPSPLPEGRGPPSNWSFPPEGGGTFFLPVPVRRGIGTPQ